MAELGQQRTIAGIDLGRISLNFLGYCINIENATSKLGVELYTYVVDWEEFKLMFHRNITDNTGLEPFQLFNVVQFMMYDKDNSGQVTIDETMHMLFARYGKKNLESQMKILFGDNLQTSDGDGELSFNEYLKAVSVRLPKNKRKKGKKGKR